MTNPASTSPGPRSRTAALASLPAEGGWYEVGETGRLVRLYCAGCETFSRPVRKPDDTDKRRVSDQMVRDLVERIHERQTVEPAQELVRAAGRALYPVLFPDPPRGWERGCPRCMPRV